MSNDEQGSDKPKPAESFGSSLDDIGFKPLGRRIKLRQGNDTIPPKIPRTPRNEDE